MKRQAFLFSASEYLESKTLSIGNLSGVKYDILAIEKRLLQIGFSIIKKENAIKSEYISTLQNAVERLPSDAISIVYFSGHGGHCNGENYIFPSDFGSQYDISKSIDNAGINIKDIIFSFKGKGRLILIIDACRSDFEFSKGYYSEMTYTENVYIAYGTMFQNSSIGINNGMSWFTEAICDEILTPNINVDTLFTRVRQNIFSKHYIQIPPSVNALLDNDVILHSDVSYDDIDKQVYDFVQKYGDEYTDKYGYFHGDDLIFIDAAQYFNIGLLDAIWKFKKVDNKINKDRGLKMPELPEAETKLESFLGFTQSKKYFTFDKSHTWYYNGRQIRMGEIPPLPLSMQQKLPEEGKAFFVEFKAEKDNNNIVIFTNLPDKCEVFVWNNKARFPEKKDILGGKIVISDAKDISKVVINSGVFTSDKVIQQMFGGKGNRNLVGEFVEYDPIHGNQLKCQFEF